MKRSTAFPLTSLLILLIGGILCFLGHCNTEKKILTFVSGILFVMAGLCTLVGLILYIGSITEEAGNKDKTSSDMPKFSYWYGSSFILAVGSFALTELSGVFSVYLYISRQKQIQRNKTKQPLKTESNERPNYLKYKRNRSRSRERSHSRERSRDTSLSRSESYFTYTPVSDTSHELCNYTFSREASGNTIMTTAETHTPRENAVPVVDFLPRSTPV